MLWRPCRADAGTLRLLQVDFPAVAVLDFLPIKSPANRYYTDDMQQTGSFID